MPSGWLEEEPLKIADPKSKRRRIAGAGALGWFPTEKWAWGTLVHDDDDGDDDDGDDGDDDDDGDDGDDDDDVVSRRFFREVLRNVHILSYILGFKSYGGTMVSNTWGKG